MNILIVVDMQNDFVSGSLKNDYCKSIVPKMVNYLKEVDKNTKLVFTLDTHDEDYLNSYEGKKLPIKHCIKGTKGHEIVDELRSFSKDAILIEKNFFSAGEVVLKNNLLSFNPEKITLIGTCTDICVISNALALKSAFPNSKIEVIENLCAGLDKEGHEAAILSMKRCQIEVKNV